MKKVLIPTKLDKVAADILTANGNYIVVQDDKTPIADLAGKNQDTYALIVRSEEITADIMEKLPSLKVIVRAGAGVNTIDTKFARKKGIDVMNTPGANSNAVAEEVVAMMLADARHVVKADAVTRSGGWEKKAFMGTELAGKTLGIVGLGNIGRLVAKRLEGFEMKVYGFDPLISLERAGELDVELVDLPTLFAKSDYISLHIPENKDTKKMINESLISLMKQGATLINCARAGIIDEDAMRKYKAEKKIRFLNDVYPKDEPGDKSVKDIADLMLPHLGASTFEANYKAARRAAEQLVDLDYKGVTSFIVNRDIPEGLDEKYCDLAYTIARLAHCLAGTGNPLKTIETTFYGNLEPFAEWLLVSVVAGVWDNFDRSMNYRAALAYLEERGISYVNRKCDNVKGFGNSMTIDLVSQVDNDQFKQMSIRGTLTESIKMIARINEFEKLYFEPVGPTLYFIYEDRTGVIGAIGSALARNGINIEDMRNPHDPKTKRSLAILKVNKAVSAELIQAIGKEIQAISAFSICL